MSDEDPNTVPDLNRETRMQIQSCNWQGTVYSTVKTLLSRLVTREFDSPVDSLRRPYVRVEPYWKARWRPPLATCYRPTRVIKYREPPGHGTWHTPGGVTPR
eukprot:8694081-Pyramimonas_sp.AAC.2